MAASWRARTVYRSKLVPKLLLLGVFACCEPTRAQPTGGQLMDSSCQTTTQVPPPRPLAEHIEKKLVELLKAAPRNHTPRVAVLDAGIGNPTDPRFRNVLWSNPLERRPPGRTSVDDDGNGYYDDEIGVYVEDPHRIPVNMHDPSRIGHGTHILGVVTGRLFPELGPLIEQRTKVMVVRVLDDDMRIKDGALLKGIQYAHDKRADIINLSLAGSCDDFEEVVAALEKQSRDNVPTLYVTAAGNTNTSIDDVCPARLSTHATTGAGVISVAAQGASDQTLASFSNDGADLAAPGMDIPSTGSFGFATCDGTSQAAALVTMTALLIYSMEDWEPALIKARILASSDYRVGLSSRVSSGGTLNIVKALLLRDDVVERKGRGLYIGTVTPTHFAYTDGSGNLELSHVSKIVFHPDGTHRIATFDGTKKKLEYSSQKLSVSVVTVDGTDPQGNPGRFDIPAAEILDIVPRSIYPSPGGGN